MKELLFLFTNKNLTPAFIYFLVLQQFIIIKKTITEEEK